MVSSFLWALGGTQFIIWMTALGASLVFFFRGAELRFQKALLVFGAAKWVHPLMPWLLSFSAGAMLYVTAAELCPEAKGRSGTMGYIFGFVLMMVLDVALA